MTGPAIPKFDSRAAMPAEAWIDATNTIDLDALMARHEDPEIVAHLTRQREQVTAIARELLEPDLKPLLEWLLDITLRRPLFLPNMGAQSLAYCALREGQNQVVWQILQAIAEGRQERPPAREGL